MTRYCSPSYFDIFKVAESHDLLSILEFTLQIPDVLLASPCRSRLLRLLRPFGLLRLSDLLARDYTLNDQESTSLRQTKQDDE